jgi:hypothetical protein
MTAAEASAYEMVLEEEAYPFEEQGIEVHEANFELLAGGIYNPWVQKSLDHLADLMPGRYAKRETTEGYLGAGEVYAYRMPITLVPVVDESVPEQPEAGVVESPVVLTTDTGVAE